MYHKIQDFLRIPIFYAQLPSFLSLFLQFKIFLLELLTKTTTTDIVVLLRQTKYVRHGSGTGGVE